MLCLAISALDRGTPPPHRGRGGGSASLALLVTERFAGERLVAVVAHARLPLRAAYEQHPRVLVRLDADGSGRHTVPKDGDFLEVPVPGDLGDLLSETQWQTVVDADRARRERALTEGAD